MAFGIISVFEMRMVQRVREKYPDDTWQRYLKENRIELAKKVMKIRSNKNEAIDLAECIQLCDKKEIYGNSERLKVFHPFDSKGKWGKFMDEVEDLRNSIAHSNSVAFATWPDVAGLVDDIEKCLILLEEGGSI